MLERPDQRLHHPLDLTGVEPVVEGEAEQSGGDVVGHRAVGPAGGEPPPPGRRVERHVVERGVHAILRMVPAPGPACRGRGAARRTCGTPARGRAGRPAGAAPTPPPRARAAPIARRPRPGACEDRLPPLELAEQVGREHIGQPERRSGVLPGVLVDLAQQELPPVRPLVVQHVGAVDVVVAVDDQGTALAADEVLGLVEAQRRERPKLPSGGPVRAEQPCALSSTTSTRSGHRWRPRMPSMSHPTPA